MISGNLLKYQDLMTYISHNLINYVSYKNTNILRVMLIMIAILSDS